MIACTSASHDPCKYFQSAQNKYFDRSEGEEICVSLSSSSWVELLERCIHNDSSTIIQEDNTGEIEFFYAKRLINHEGSLVHETVCPMERQEKIRSLLSASASKGNNDALYELALIIEGDLCQNLIASSEGAMGFDDQEQDVILESIHDQFKSVKPTLSAVMEMISAVDCTWFDELIALLQSCPHIEIPNIPTSSGSANCGMNVPCHAGISYLFGQTMLRKRVAQVLLYAGIDDKVIRHLVSNHWSLVHHHCFFHDNCRYIPYDIIPGYQEIVRLWERAAVGGDSDAQTYLAIYYHHGAVDNTMYHHHCPFGGRFSACHSGPMQIKYKEARQLFEAAANSGQLKAMVALASSGKLHDDESVSTYWRRQLALRCLGIKNCKTCLESSILVDELENLHHHFPGKRRRKNTTSYRASLNYHEVPRFWHNLSSLALEWRPLNDRIIPYEAGFDIVKTSLDSNAAERLLATLETAFKNDPDACDANLLSNLAYCYQLGLGVPSNIHRAIKFLHLAATIHGDHKSAFLLGDWYFCGCHGLQVDLAKAESYWRLAVLHGSVIGRIPLAYMAQNLPDKIDQYLTVLAHVMNNSVPGDEVALSTGMTRLSFQALACYKDDPYLQNKLHSADLEVMLSSLPVDFDTLRNIVSQSSQCTCSICDAKSSLLEKTRVIRTMDKMPSLCSSLFHYHHMNVVMTTSRYTGEFGAMINGKLKKMRFPSSWLNLGNAQIRTRGKRKQQEILQQEDEAVDVILHTIDNYDFSNLSNEDDIYLVQEVDRIHALSRECRDQFIGCYGHHRSNGDHSQCYYLVLEPPAYGSLHAIIVEDLKPSMSLMVKWMGEILTAMELLDGKGLYHGNLQPSTVWICKGLRAKVVLTPKSKSFASHSPYAAPDASGSLPSDLYSFALISASMIANRVLTLEMSSNRDSIVGFINDAKDRAQAHREVQLSAFIGNVDTFIDMMTKCTSVNSEDRLPLSHCTFVVKELAGVCRKLPISSQNEEKLFAQTIENFSIGDSAQSQSSRRTRR